MDPNFGATAPYESTAGAQRPRARNAADSLVLGPKNGTIEKMRVGQSIGLGWSPLVGSTQQSTERCWWQGGRWRGDPTGWNVWGGQLPIVDGFCWMGGRNNQQKVSRNN
jgi:hypothetical protein